MAAGVSAWVFSKTQQRTGNNTASSSKLSAIVGVMVFIFTLMLLSIVDNALGN